MSLWITASLLAAAFQTVRFMLQKRLAAATLSATGATFARFVYSAPIAVVGASIYMWLQVVTIPKISPVFWVYGIAGGAAQVFATVCLVKLFAARNFAVGVTFAKTEVILTVFVGLLILGEGVSWLAFGAICLGVVGVVLLSVDPNGTNTQWTRVFNRAAGLGVLAGLLFSVSAVGYRGASLEVLSPDPFVRAGLTLAAVTSLQTFGMALWLLWKDPGEARRVLQAWRSASLIGVTSVAGSFGWFLAFTLQAAAYVKAIGQIELIFGLLVSVFVFKERPGARELVGMAILTASIVVLLLSL